MDVEKMIESAIRALMFMAGILGNSWLAVVSLPKRKSGIHTSEVLFINLAISNLITNCLVDLPDIIADIARRWFLGKTFCGIFQFCSDLSETSSIFTTLFISVFWHQKLVGSLKRGGAPVQLDSLRLVGCLLAGSWTLATVFSIPHFFFVSVEGTNQSHEDCVNIFPDELSKQIYGVTFLTVANAFPLVGIIIASVQIVVTLLQNQKRVLNHYPDPSKATTKRENNLLENKPKNVSVGPGSDPGTSTADTDCTSPTHTGAGEPSPAGPHGDLLNKSQQNLPVNSKSDCRVETPPNLSNPGQVPLKRGPSTSPQVRAAKSVVAVASVVLMCWLTHLLLRISDNIRTSPVVLEVASYIAASYICIIPYILLHGVKKLSCSCKY